MKSKIQIIVDSCCDMTRDMLSEMGVISVPLTMLIGDKEFRDDETLNMHEFMDTMKNSTGKNGSAAPAPYLYQQAIEKSEKPFIITLSKKLSASFSNAVLGCEAAAENGNDVACVLDSKSACAGETLIAIKIYELLKAGLNKERIVEIIHKFIDDMKTYFVLENYDNLQKNGRLGKVTGKIIQILNIKLIMGADGNGEIALFEKCRGVKRMLSHLISLIESSGKDTRDENLVISHCNNPGLAAQLSALIKEKFHFKKIYIVPTGGLSSLYADDQGIIMSF